MEERFPRRKKLAFCIAEPSLTGRDWTKKRQEIICSGGICRLDGKRVKIASKQLNAVNPSEYILSHATIIAAVETEEGHGIGPSVKYSDYLIVPDYDPFKNDNDDAWERKLLWGSFPTFVGADNFMEHVQLKEFSRGVILDAVPRIVRAQSPATGKTIEVLYIDLLVATHRQHDKLCRGILSGEISRMSMGCSLDFTICSRCGQVIYEDEQICEHLDPESGMRGMHWIDERGIKRITAELCGHHTDPMSCRFTEASWVDIPAASFAVSRNIVNLDLFKRDNPKLVGKVSSLLKRALLIQSARKELEARMLKVVKRLDMASADETEIFTLDQVFKAAVLKQFRG